MKWDSICPICMKEFELNDEVTCEDSTLYHMQCVSKKEKRTAQMCEDKLAEVILNFDQLEEYAQFSIDLEEFAAYVQEIVNNTIFITFTAEEGAGFGCYYSNDTSLKEFEEFMEQQRQDNTYIIVTSVIKERRFVEWEDIPRSIKIKES